MSDVHSHFSHIHLSMEGMVARLPTGKTAIGPEVIANRMRLLDVAWDETTGELVWLESHEGRGTLFASNLTGDAPRQLTTSLNVRGRLGYGGGDFTVADGNLYFAADGGRLYRQSLRFNDPRPITPPFGAAAAPVVSADGDFVAYVHSFDEIDRIAVVDEKGEKWPHILVEGDDFYMQPRWDSTGELFAYIAWNFPHMPWDGTELRVGRFDRKAPGGPCLRDVEVIAGGTDISVMQPEFSPDGRLLTYISDERGYWQIYAYDLRSGEHVRLTTQPYEHGSPAWVQGIRTYDFSPDGRSLYYIRNEGGYHKLFRCHLYDETGRLQPVHDEIAYSPGEMAVMSQIALPGAWPPAKANSSATDSTGVSDDGPMALIVSAPRIPSRIVVLRVNLRASDADNRVKTTTDKQEKSPFWRLQVVKRSQAENFAAGMLSEPQTLTWQTEAGTPVSGLYYPPTERSYRPSDGPPPAVVSIHSGPTSQSLPEFNAKAQFFTSRGYAYIEPNYRGSTGFGREFRNLLQGNWGVVDVEDALAAGRMLADKGLADGDRLVVMGSSAGGFTALRALCEHPGFFRAAICMYGVADLFGLAMDTHKFERHYTDGLIGPLPDAADLYEERSPVFHAHRIQDPVAVFQGTEDNVVPKSQADAVVAALRRNGVPHEYYVYEGEGHGFRNEATVAAVYGAIERFLQRYVIFAS